MPSDACRIPPLYALGMVVAGISALISRRLFDRHGVGGHESVMCVAASRLFAPERRASAFGVFNACSACAGSWAVWLWDGPTNT